MFTVSDLLLYLVSRMTINSEDKKTHIVHFRPKGPPLPVGHSSMVNVNQKLFNAIKTWVHIFMKILDWLNILM